MNKEQITALAREHGTRYTNRHALGKPAFAFGDEAWADFVDALVAVQPAQPTQAESKPCFMCHGQGWHYIAYAYPPGVTVPKVKMACTQCVVQPVQPTDDRASFEKWAGREGLNIRRSEPKTKGGIPSSRFGLCPATYYFDEAECAWRAWANKPISQLVQLEVQPVAVISGAFGGRPCIRVLDTAAIYPDGTALYTSPPIAQPVQPAETADAARYRWLRQGSYIGVGCKDPEVAAWNQKYLNSTIDAAMKEPK